MDAEAQFVGDEGDQEDQGLGVACRAIEQKGDWPAQAEELNISRNYDGVSEEVIAYSRSVCARIIAWHGVNQTSKALHGVVMMIRTHQAASFTEMQHFQEFDTHPDRLIYSEQEHN